MDPATLIGIGIAGAALLVGVILEGGNPVAFIAPSAFLIVFGGTAGAMIAHVITFASYRRTLVAGALHDAGCDDLDSGDPIRWITRTT